MDRNSKTLTMKAIFTRIAPIVVAIRHVMTLQRHVVICTDTWKTAFAVHHSDSLNPNVFDNTNPTRPPSRVSNRNEQGYDANLGRLLNLLHPRQCEYGILI